eukprot:gnl/Dysnectes_brevis/10359_a20420_165.p1 GENE.gnl/Dysnectes_brevis/10359_a20420_165~~gnl/Dysnectes_brevis/10359_a20420_165.p1  ORF type:complete len:419 (-),score=99.67 gnl/Dysnectes_brevis/10359_a20420_165:33-1289(-)
MSEYPFKALQTMINTSIHPSDSMNPITASVCLNMLRSFNPNTNCPLLHLLSLYSTANRGVEAMEGDQLIMALMESFFNLKQMDDEYASAIFSILVSVSRTLPQLLTDASPTLMQLLDIVQREKQDRGNPRRSKTSESVISRQTSQLLSRACLFCSMILARTPRACIPYLLSWDISIGVDLSIFSRSTPEDQLFTGPSLVGRLILAAIEGGAVEGAIALAGDAMLLGGSLVARRFLPLMITVTLQCEPQYSEMAIQVLWDTLLVHPELQEVGVGGQTLPLLLLTLLPANTNTSITGATRLCACTGGGGVPRDVLRALLVAGALLPPPFVAWLEGDGRMMVRSTMMEVVMEHPGVIEQDIAADPGQQPLLAIARYLFSLVEEERRMPLCQTLSANLRDVCTLDVSAQVLFERFNNSGESE